ncbi:MAG: diacylglycerol kinase family lipid kinase [Clostridia bacterium]|nr:diacylglycerol kinase family lipid kinase [Clostridia bacterium]
MRIRMIINPVAGTKTVQKTAIRISDKLVKDGVAERVDIFKTQKEGDAYREARSLSDYDCVVAVGGDGTVNEVLYGVIKSGSNIPVAVLAAGTVNDFAYSLGLPNTCDEFCDMIKHARVEKIDMGLCQDRYFANVVAGGAFSEVAYSVSADRKNRFGKLAYYVSGAKTLPKTVRKSEKLVFEYDGGKMEVDTFLFLISNTSSVGGFRKISPFAKVDDGMLDVCIIKKIKTRRIFPLFIKLWGGKHTNDKDVIYFQTNNLKVSCVQEGERLPLDIDGEKIGTLPAQIECIRGAIRLFVTENMNFN